MTFARWCLLLVLGFATSSGRSEDTDATLGIEPLVAILPANFLKFYLRFSEPMERGDVFRYLRLVKIQADGSEEEVVEPFREVELWGAHFETLTLWLHPGRQKPGVNLNVDLGPVLEEGERYRLLVSTDWKTQSGGRLGGDLSKAFRAGPVDKTQPDPAGWTVKKLSSNNLLIKTDDLLDPASLRKRIRVIHGVIGEILPARMQAVAHIVTLELVGEPVAVAGGHLNSWPPGEYHLIVNPQLEDLAGNSIARPFNLDLEKHPDFVEKTEAVEIPFTIEENLKLKLTEP